MKQFILLATLFTFAPTMTYAKSSNIWQFQGIYDAMAIKNNDPKKSNNWDAITKIKGVKWQWQLNQIASHHYSMLGELPLKPLPKSHPYIDPTSISVEGSASNIQRIEITADAPVDYDYGNGLVLDKLFKGVKYTKIKTRCDITDRALEGNEYYKVTKKGYKPLYLNYGYSRGNHGDGSEFARLTYEIECK